MSGSFDGTQSGDDVTGLVTGLSNVAVFHDGVPYVGNGALYANSWQSGLGWVSGGAVASFSAFNNNFFFIDCNWTYAAACPFTNFAYSYLTDFGGHLTLSWLHPTTTATAFSPFDASYSSRWSLRRVPEPGTLALLGLGLAGLGLSRRRKTN